MKNKKFVLKWTKKPDYRKSAGRRPNGKFLRQLEQMLLEGPKKSIRAKKSNVQMRAPVPLTYARFRAKTFKGKRPFRKTSASLNRIFFRRFTRRFQKQTPLPFRQIFGFASNNLDVFSFSRWFNRFFYKRRRLLAFRFFHVIRKLKKYKYLSRRRGKKKFFVLPKDFRVKYRKFTVRAVTRIAPNFFKSKRRLFKRFKRTERVRPAFARKSKRFKAAKLHSAFASAAYNFSMPKSIRAPIVFNYALKVSQFGVTLNNFSTPMLDPFPVVSQPSSVDYSLSFAKGFRDIFYKRLNSNAFAELVQRERCTNSLRYFFASSHRRAPLRFFQPNQTFSRSSKIAATALHVARRKKLNSYRNKVLAGLSRKRLASKLSFALTQQSKRATRLVSRKIFSRKKFLRFKPFLGVFGRHGRIHYKFKRKRLKFFGFFRKYFKLFRQYSGTRKNKYRKISKNVRNLQYYLHVFRSVNNLFVNVSTPLGRSIYVYSAGRTPYRGSKRLSPIAIETMGKNVSEILRNSEVPNIFIVFHSPVDFLSRALLRGLRTNIQFSGFRYHLNRPHNGLRKRASRRV
jgi:ribosomal protein S11